MIAGNATVTLANSTISGNTSNDLSNGSGGGGLYLNAAAQVTITQCTIANNFALSDGGGIHIDDTTVSLKVYNSTIAGNQGNDGGGVNIDVARRCSSKAP